MNASNTQKLKKARVLLILEQPFFGTLATRLINAEDKTIPTACTNGKVIYWNPQFLAELSDKEVQGIVAHEIMHVANGHTWRRDSRDVISWNIACDKAINEIITESGLTLPKGALFPTNEEKGKSAEAVYIHNPTKDGNRDPGRCGMVMDSPTDAKNLAQEWKVAIAQAATTAKAYGKLPACLERFTETILNPKVPWSVILRDFIEKTSRNDYNWNVPNRRHLQRGIVLPTLISEQLPEIVIAVDTSGSITREQLDQFSAEINAILGGYDTTIHVVYADADVHKTEVYSRADLPISLKGEGGGGTDFRPAFDWVEKQGWTPAAMIYLTDGEGNFPEKQPDHPVLWVLNSGIREVPFGEAVVMD